MYSQVINAMKGTPMTIKDWNIQAMTGYVPQTTIYSDFSIADRFGVAAVRDTFNRMHEEWKNNHIYLTELTMALNWKIWEHYETGNNELGLLYDELWKQEDLYCQENLTGEELEYYYTTTD